MLTTLKFFLFLKIFQKEFLSAEKRVDRAEVRNMTFVTEKRVDRAEVRNMTFVTACEVLHISHQIVEFYNQI